ncbi:MAG: hypothetical protein PHF18_17875 [Methanosarcina sp.]|uniref:hypothetical protein n=1 Tax=Methanosarcina sp. TaxID=2213 RepID=UPI00262BFE1D|nr:hypothetical protein [Methanosarcina sp.]MDD3248698.1 hypothetical protein [Methanosarcina sp.]
MIKDIPDITLTVNTPEELPENLFKFYDSLTRNERVISLSQIGGGLVQATTKDGDTGLFRKDLIPKQGKMYLSYQKHSPLFVEFPGKLVVIAPCEFEG